jgi:tRNA(fMet)-specific endonuclease VapC
MTRPKTLLDTDVLSAIMRRNVTATARSQDYLADHPQLSFSILTRFEILRGLKAKSASTRVAQFDQFCGTCEVVDLTETIVSLSSDIYADLYQRGELIGDADTLIAATAIAGDFVLDPNNVAHFARIPRLRIDNWLQ